MATPPKGSPPVPADPHAQDELLDALYRAHAASLRGRVLAMTHDPSVADDVVGDAFLRLAIAVRAGRGPDDPPAWLARVARNLVVSRGRRATVAARALPAILDRGLAPSPEEMVVEHERDRFVREALSDLEPDDRAIVVLAASGYRPGEIAGLTGRSGPATRTRLCRARGRIRAQLRMVGVVV